MTQYYVKDKLNWAPANVRGLMVDKNVVCNRGFDILSSLFCMDAGMVIDKHTHHEWVQVVVLEGEMQIESKRDGVARVGAGGCYVIEPGDTHTETSVTETIVLVTQLDKHGEYPRGRPSLR